jgi:hypothetical protein
VQLRSLSDGIVTWTTPAAAAFDTETVRLHRVVRAKDGNFIAVGVTEEDGYAAAVEITIDGTVKRKFISTVSGDRGGGEIGERGREIDICGGC